VVAPLPPQWLRPCDVLRPLADAGGRYGHGLNWILVGPGLSAERKSQDCPRNIRKLFHEKPAEVSRIGMKIFRCYVRAEFIHYLPNFLGARLFGFSQAFKPSHHVYGLF
jgi:hypothetical protein